MLWNEYITWLVPVLPGELCPPADALLPLVLTMLPSKVFRELQELAREPCPRELLPPEDS